MLIGDLANLAVGDLELGFMGDVARHPVAEGRHDDERLSVALRLQVHVGGKDVDFRERRRRRRLSGERRK